jgi:L-alanine-DL-glutamate epimerase-like enolase superfamily enzyme
VSLSDKEKMVADAKKILQEGYPVIKVKLGGNPQEDIERMRAIRAAVGPEITIRIDANQGWSLEGAKTALHAMAGMKIEHCEEPLPRWQYDLLPELRDHVSVPLMADESCCNEYDVRRLIDSNACHGINIKLGKSSGFIRARRIAAAAGAAGLKLQVGGFLESRLGFTASAHFAVAHPEISCIDFDTPLMFTADPVSGGIIYGKNGRVDLEEGPGLGASLLPESMSSLDAVTV